MSKRSRTSTEIAIPLRRPRLLGLLALLLWSAAPTASGTAAILGYDRVKVLIFAAGLVMMDLAAAIVISMMWFVARHYIKPLNENKAENEYSYRAGYRDATFRYTRPDRNIYLVKPVVPQHFPSQQPRGVATEREVGG